MDKARLLLMNLDFGIFPKACIHKEISEVGWLLYSTRQQNEERFSELIYNLVHNGAPSTPTTDTGNPSRTTAPAPTRST
jgi:hypothetical protein